RIGDRLQRDDLVGGARQRVAQLEDRADRIRENAREPRGEILRTAALAPGRTPPPSLASTASPAERGAQPVARAVRADRHVHLQRDLERDDHAAVRAGGGSEAAIHGVAVPRRAWI